ncbi:hypothetical protein [Candidatus Uabimicrobium amorphum]|uniref:Uncharacterized protein n=1 Tax=Uabimicrobium amorphum TaxID=2596890 RepID=A0A5S9IVR8_UABAM|nr:hypothetical protein [Candidatus Uabimicrobium amorphum]BBM87980.1 hypothetical protein UABAM_06396 [Candidatus Uabimicrobium amorphum]
MNYFAFVIALFFVGCSSNLMVLNKELIDKFNLSEENLKSLQVYVSEDVEMRKIEDNDSIVKDGQITPNAQKDIQDVIIEEMTPGVILIVDEDILAVSFQKGSALIFSDQDAAYIISTNDGKVNFNGSEYLLVDGFDAFLYVDANFEEVSEKTQTITGQPIDE